MLRTIVTNSGWWLTERLTAIALSAVTSIVLTRVLGPGAYGHLSYLLALVGLLTPLSQAGANGLVTRALLEHRSDEQAVLGAALALRLAGTLVAVAAGLLYAALLEPADANRWLFVLLLAVQPATIMQVLEFWFQAHLRAARLVQLRLSTSLLTAATKIAVALATRSLVAVALVYAAETLAVAATCAVAYRRTSGRWAWPAFAPRWLDWFVRRATWLLLSGIAEIVNLRIDIVMLERMRGAVETGQYAVAARLSEIWYGVPTLIAASAFPALWARRLQGQAYERALQAALDALAWLAIALAIAVQWGAGPLVHTLFGAAYAPAAPILKVHIWAGVFVFMRAILSRWLLLEDLVRYALVTQVAGAVLNVVLNFWLIPQYGGLGSAFATVVSYATSGMFALFLTGRTRPIGIMMLKALLLVLRPRAVSSYLQRLLAAGR